MIDAIYLGRRINENLTKAIRYIISIHFPIILLVMLPIFFGWLPALLFTPIHVIFLELIMGPTCSIIYENEPTPENELKNPSNSTNTNLLRSSQLLLTLLQGVMITLGCVVIGYFGSSNNYEETKIRALIFTNLILSNVFLTLINRSFTETIFKTIKRKNRLIPIIISLSLLLLLLILYVPALNAIFEVVPLTFLELMIPVLIAFGATFWIEPLKYFNKNMM